MLKLLPQFSCLAAVLTFALAMWAVTRAGGGPIPDVALLYVPMVPASASLFMLLGAAHAIYRLDRSRRILKRVERTAAGIAILAVLIILSQDLEALAPLWAKVAEVLGGEGPRPLARMATSSGVAFILTALSMLADTLDGTRARRAARSAAALAATLGCFGLSRVFVAYPSALSSRPMALMAAGGFLLLNLALLLDRRPVADPRSPARQPLPGVHSTRLLAATLLLILIAASAGSIYMRRQSDQALLSSRRELDAIADLKVAQVTAWRASRIRDGRFLMRAAWAMPGLSDSGFGTRAVSEQQLAEWLSPLLSEGQARSLEVIGPDGGRQFAIPARSAAEIPRIPRRAAWSDVELGDLSRHADGALSLDVFVPLRRGPVTPILVIRIDPAQTLLPVIHGGPAPLKSLESTLWRREGEDLIALGSGALSASVAMSLRRSGLPQRHHESEAVAGSVVAHEGVNHRGVPVVVTARAIPGTSWTLSTSIDQAELYAPIQQDAARTAFFVIVFLFGLVGFAAYVAREESAQALEKALRAEREHAATSKRLATLMKSANDMILLFDDESRVVDVNDRVLEVYGYAREEIIGMDVARLRADGDAAAVASSRVAFSAAGGARMEVVHRRKDGTTFLIEASGWSVEIDGRPLVMAIYRDVSERRAQDEALRQSEERLRLLGDNLPDSYLYQLVQERDGRRRFVYASSGVSKLHGISVADLLADSTLLARQTAPEDLPRVAEAEAESLRAMTDFSIEIRIRRADGAERWLQVRSRPRAHGEAVIWDGVATDITARRRADEALRQAQSAVEHSPVSILMTDADWRIRYVNPAFTRITGYSEDEAIGRTPRDLLGDGNPQELHDEAEARLSAGHPWQGVFRNRRKSGERFWEDTHIAAVRNAQGTITSYVAVKEDTTAKREAEDALRASESKLGVALDIADLGCYETWMEGDRGIADERTKSLFGIRDGVETEMRASLLANVHREDRERVVAAVARFRAGEADRFAEEYRFAESGRPEIWISHVARAVERASDGAVTHTIGVVKDITAEKRASDALRRSEERHRLLADNANDVIWTTDTNGVLTYISPSVERLRGYAPAELIGRPVGESVTSEVRERVANMFTEAVAAFATGGRPEGPVAQRFEIDQPCRDGSILHTEATASPLFDAEDRFIGILGVTRDMTARHAADEALKASEVRLQMAIETAGLGIIESRDGTHVPDMMARGILGLHDVPAEQVTDLWASRVDRGDLDRVRQAREDFLAGRLPSAANEYRYHHPERGLLWISHTSRALEFDEHGRTTRAVVVLKDVTDMRRAEQDLRNSESRLAMALEAAEIGLYWSDGVVFGSDARAAAILQVSGDDWNLALEAWTLRLHAEDREQALATVRRLREGQATQVQLEYRYHHPEKGVVWIAHSLRLVRQPGSGEPERVIGVVKDVTAAREASEALRRSEERFRAGLAAIQEGFVIFDRNKQVVVANATATRILGLGAGDDVPSTGPRQFRTLREDGSALPPDEYPSSRTLNDGKPIRDFVMGVVRPNGPTHWLLVSSAPIGDPEQPEMVVVSFTDITARRAAEAELQRAEERWKFAVEGAGDGVWDWDVPSGTCVFSARWKQMLGYGDDEIGTDLKEWTERVHPDDLSPVLAKLQPHLDGVAPSYAADHRLRRKDGVYIWILDRGLVVSRDASGRPLRVVGTHSDITARRQAEEDLRNLAATRAQQLDELRRWQQAMLGREDRIQELKREANALAKAAGREVPYPSQEPVA